MNFICVIKKKEKLQSFIEARVIFKKKLNLLKIVEQLALLFWIIFKMKVIFIFFILKNRNLKINKLSSKIKMIMNL